MLEVNFVITGRVTSRGKVVFEVWGRRHGDLDAIGLFTERLGASRTYAAAEKVRQSLEFKYAHDHADDPNDDLRGLRNDA